MNSKDVVQKLPRAFISEPFQFALTLVFLLSSANILLGFGDSTALRNIGPDNLFFYYWTISTIVGGTLTLGGMFWSSATTKVRRVILAHWVEKLGLILMGTAMVLYSVIIFALTGTSALIGALLFAILGVTYYVKILILNASELALKSTVKLANEYIDELQQDKEGEEE